MNRLQDVLSVVHSGPLLELPQLVVVGSQSTGKSSVLENIVGRDFLPRGNDIVTRRPLILQLVNSSGLALGGAAAPSPSSSSSSSSPVPDDAEYGEFLHRPGRMHDFDAIREEIARETERVTGHNKGISSKPIRLRIVSPYVLNLTLVDLPGLTKIPVGDQPADIEQRVRDMVLSYIENPNAVIVAVSSANNDIANSESLKMARQVDPDGNRTLGLITKLDLMDRGTDARALLQGAGPVHLKLGFIGVVNRSQADINSGKSIRDALESEREFFRTHPTYRAMSNRLGTPYVARRLNEILMDRIRAVLPLLKAQITSQIAETEEELASYGSPLAESGLVSSADALSPLLLQLLSKFAAGFSNALEGLSPDVSVTELYGGARISYVFNDIFSQGVADVNPFHVLTDDDIRRAIRTATGTRPALFVPEAPFEILVKRQINRLLSPSLQCVELVYAELQRLATQCESLVPELQRFPVLRRELTTCVMDLLSSRVDPTKEMVTRLIRIEASYVNTSHVDFIGGTKAVSRVMQRMAAKKRRERDERRRKRRASQQQEELPDLPLPSTSPTPGANAKSKSWLQRLRDFPLGSGGDALSKSRLHGPNSPPQLGRQRSDSAPASPREARDRRTRSRSRSNRNAARDNPAFSHSDDDAVDDPNQAALSTATSSSRTSGLFSMLFRKGKDSEVTVAPAPANSNVPNERSHSAGVRAPSNTISAPARTRTQHERAPRSLEDLESPTERDVVATEITKMLIASYYSVVKRNIQDAVPKGIMHFLVNHVKTALQSHLVSALYKTERLQELLSEAEDIAARRQACQELLEILRRSFEIVSEVRDYKVGGV